MLHFQEGWYLKRATKEIQATTKCNLHSQSWSKCTLNPEKERDGNQLASKSNRPPKRGPLGPHSGCKNVYRLNQINMSGPL